MKFIQLPLRGAYVIEPEAFQDKRGTFVRLFCKDELKRIKNTREIVQINHSITVQKGAVRGMHYQRRPKAEIKIVKCLCGAIFDVIIDLRKGSPTFLKWYGEILSAENMRMLYIPEGFAHGFQTLESNSELLYFHTEFYSPRHEGGIRYDDPRVGIQWPLEVVEISERDMNHPLINDNFSGISI